MESPPRRKTHPVRPRSLSPLQYLARDNAPPRQISRRSRPTKIDPGVNNCSGRSSSEGISAPPLTLERLKSRLFARHELHAFRIQAGDKPQALYRRLSFKNANAAMRLKGHIGLNETGFQTTLTIPATFATEPSDVDATAVTPWTPHVLPSLHGHEPGGLPIMPGIVYPTG